MLFSCGVCLLVVSVCVLFLWCLFVFFSCGFCLCSFLVVSVCVLFLCSLFVFYSSCGVYFLSVKWSKTTIRIQRDEEEDEVSTFYP